MRRLLITGAGKAAMACIEQLSKLKHHFLITVLRAPAGSESAGHPEFDEARLKGLGIEVRVNVCAESFDRHARVVRGCDGSRTTFDTLVLAADSENASLARAAGLEVHAGVLLNDFLQTSDAHIYALGEGAELRGTIYSDSRNIDEQARVLAAHVAGLVPAAFAPVNHPAKVPSTALANRSSAIKTCASLPAFSAGSELRSEAQTPELKGLPALAGVA